MTIAAGTSINQYKIISRLGAGGMGEVYLAQDVKLGRKVALKLLYEDVKQGEDWVRRFEQEARATSILNHPNIITVYEVGQADGSHFISTEFIDGQTLRERLNDSEDRILPLREVLDIAIQVTVALTTAHESRIIHRDIKPENVMLRWDGYVKVLDFGLAKFVEKRMLGMFASDPEAETQPQGKRSQDSPAPFVNTNPGMVMGTVSYMSPEQAQGRYVDSRSDIFSLGILLYEMLTGRLPFEGATAAEVIIAIVQKRPRPMARFVPDIHPEMARIVSKALSKNKEERYQTIKDMLIDLKRLKRGLDFELVVGEEQEHEPPPRPPAANDGFRVLPKPTKEFNDKTTIPPTVSSAEYIFKGIARHKRVALLAVGAVVAALVAYYYYSATRPIDSIAVLPFYDSRDPGAEHHGDELTEQVIESLSKVPTLRVIPFDVALGYKGQPAPEAGYALNVRAVLTGRVIKSGDDVTFSAVLIDLRNNTVLWEGKPSEVFPDIALASQSIVSTIYDKIGLTPIATDQRKKDAEVLYTRGRYAWKQRKTDDLYQAIDFFNQALNSDPNHARAYAGLADCYNMLATYGALAPNNAFRQARDAAMRALAIDRNLSEAHAALAYAKFRGEWNWIKAEEEFKEAIRLNERNASAHQWYASYLAAMSRFKEAEAETRRTQDFDKTSLIINSHFGLVYFFAGRFDDSIAACRKTLERDPSFFAAHRYLGLAYAQKGMFKEALEHSEKALELSKGSPLMKAERARVLALSGDVGKAQSELKELQEMAKQHYISAYHIAAIHAALGRQDRAFEWLEQALDEHADWMVYLKVDPRFESLRPDSRFTDLLRRMELE